MIVCEYSIISFLWVLVLVMVIFYSVGTIIRLILSRFFNDDNKKEEKELGEEDSEENASNEAEEQTENVSDDGNVKSGKK